ncbi:hypothetical protein J5N97_030132 [Dioscorea zingiberensis]|uniref:Uncharacterized protein n=1 Tax=Dioscorea zingiberensis TaxID=325984 RepID=A0A9D5BX71_9LILI|nr:hypothetical protein J5N97_030132 [Dioscorea zingiberensis]
METTSSPVDSKETIVMPESSSDTSKEHPWIRVDGDVPDKPIDSAILSRMKQFRAIKKLKKMELRVGS